MMRSKTREDSKLTFTALTYDRGLLLRFFLSKREASANF